MLRWPRTRLVCYRYRETVFRRRRQTVAAKQPEGAGVQFVRGHAALGDKGIKVEYVEYRCRKRPGRIRIGRIHHHGALLDADMTADALILLETQLKTGVGVAPKSWTSA